MQRSCSCGATVDVPEAAEETTRCPGCGRPLGPSPGGPAGPPAWLIPTAAVAVGLLLLGVAFLITRRETPGPLDAGPPPETAGETPPQSSPLPASRAVPVETPGSTATASPTPPPAPQQPEGAAYNGRSPSAWIAALESPDPVLRRRAGGALAHLGPYHDPAPAALRAALDDPDPAAQLAIARALVRCEPAASELVARTLGETLAATVGEVPQVRANIGRELTQLGPRALASAAGLRATVAERPWLETAWEPEALVAAAPRLEPHLLALHAALARWLDGHEPRHLREAVVAVVGDEFPEAAIRAAMEACTEVSKARGQDRHAFAREQAARALGALGTVEPETLVQLQAALADHVPLVSKAAGEALGRLGALELLNEAVRDPRMVVRVGAATGLAAAEESLDDAMQGLVLALNDPERRVQQAATEALAHAGERVAAALGTVLREPGPARGRAAYVLWRLRDRAAPALEALLAVLGGEPWPGRRNVYLALGNCGPQARAAVPGLLAALARPGDEHAAAAEALGRIGEASPEVLGALEDALGHRDKRAREAAAQALGKLGTAASGAAPRLVACLEGEREARVQVACANALGALGAAEGVPLLLTLLAGPDSELRRRAAQALGSCGGAAPGQVVPALAALLSDSTPQLAHVAAQALGELGSAARPAVQPLARLARSKQGSGWISAVQALGRIEGEPAVGILVKLARGSDPTQATQALIALETQAHAAASARPPLLELLRRQAAPRSQRIAETLGHIASADELLADLAATTDPTIRGWLAYALGNCAQPERAVPALCALLQGDAPGPVKVGAARALARFPEQAATSVPALVQALDHDEALCITVADALKALGPAARSAGPVLRERLPAAPWHLRRSYAETIAAVEAEPR